MATRQGFTLVELVTVIVILGVLAAVAMPVYLDYRQDAKAAADTAAIAAIKAALYQAHVRHRAMESPSSEWVTAVSQIPSVMQGGVLPSNITVQGSVLRDLRGNSYVLTAETAAGAARLQQIGGVQVIPIPPPIAKSSVVSSEW